MQSGLIFLAHPVHWGSCRNSYCWLLQQLGSCGVRSPSLSSATSLTVPAATPHHDSLPNGSSCSLHVPLPRLGGVVATNGWRSARGGGGRRSSTSDDDNAVLVDHRSDGDDDSDGNDAAARTTPLITRSTILLLLLLLMGVGNERQRCICPRQGGGAFAAPSLKEKNRGKVFYGLISCTIRNFVNFSYIYFRAECFAPKIDWARTPMLPLLLFFSLLWFYSSAILTHLWHVREFTLTYDCLWHVSRRKLDRWIFVRYDLTRAINSHYSLLVVL